MHLFRNETWATSPDSAAAWPPGCLLRPATSLPRSGDLFDTAQQRYCGEDLRHALAVVMFYNYVVAGDPQGRYWMECDGCHAVWGKVPRHQYPVRGVWGGVGWRLAAEWVLRLAWRTTAGGVMTPGVGGGWKERVAQ